MKDAECDLRCENQQLRTDLQHHISKTEDLIKRLEHIKQKETEYKELVLQLENGEREVIISYNIVHLFCNLLMFLKNLQIENLNSQIINKEEIIRDQSDELEALRNRFLLKNQQVEEDLSELNASENEMLSALYDRIQSMKNLLREKSDCMVKLQADYKLLEVRTINCTNI